MAIVMPRAATRPVRSGHVRMAMPQTEHTQQTYTKAMICAVMRLAPTCRAERDTRTRANLSGLRLKTSAVTSHAICSNARGTGARSPGLQGLAAIWRPAAARTAPYSTAKRLDGSQIRLLRTELATRKPSVAQRHAHRGRARLAMACRGASYISSPQMMQDVASRSIVRPSSVRLVGSATAVQTAISVIQTKTAVLPLVRSMIAKLMVVGPIQKRKTSWWGQTPTRAACPRAAVTAAARAGCPMGRFPSNQATQTTLAVQGLVAFILAMKHWGGRRMPVLPCCRQTTMRRAA
mmetsp:Transcript_57333/g.134163  ORF Transcript_57333/g.134163 Transcript_57333/m.134163 type:complete len:292 (+) Transcript_57333:263-1138(+)